MRKLLFALCPLLLAVVSCATPLESQGEAPPSDSEAENLFSPQADGTFGNINGGTTASSKGYFDAPIAWPLVGVHASTLPNGKVLTWASSHPEGNQSGEYMVNKTSTAVDLWDPITDTHTRVDNTGQELFCSGHALDATGRLVVTGGNNGVIPGGGYSGANTAFGYNAFQNTWVRLPNMADGRWYPTTTALANGEVLTVGGINLAGTANNLIPEVLQSNNTWRALGGASRGVALYPWQHVAPNGQVLMSGPDANMGYLNTTGAGSASSAGTRDGLYRYYGTSVMYAAGKLLVLGGGSASALTLDLYNNAKVTNVGSMANVRTNMNATLLPDGKVFVNGGNSDGDLNNDTNSVYASELWNPSTGQWSLGANATVPRNYHSTAVLLPDGRVLTTGSRLCGAGCALNHLNAELYYPPYLFKKDGSGQLAQRPNIASFSASAPLSSAGRLSLNVGRRKASTISRVTFVRMGSTTHAFNMDQRFLEAKFVRAGSDWLTVEAPNNPNIAPPGYYMVFVVDTAGVPSVGRIVRLRLP